MTVCHYQVFVNNWLEATKHEELFVHEVEEEELEVDQLEFKYASIIRLVKVTDFSSRDAEFTRNKVSGPKNIPDDVANDGLAILAVI